MYSTEAKSLSLKNNSGFWQFLEFVQWFTRDIVELVLLSSRTLSVKKKSYFLGKTGVAEASEHATLTAVWW